jgi:GT2 family glycosyltransferase
MTGSEPRVSVVVATRDRWPDLERSLPHHEAPVVLVDNGSRDRTVESVRAGFPEVQVVTAGENLGAVGRNVGVATVATPYVAFADDDSWWAPGALERAADLFDAHPRLALLAGRILVGPEERLDPVCAEMAHSPLPRAVDLPGPPVLGFVACGAVVRRSAFLEAGGFDPVVHFPGEEERLALDLVARGWGLAYVDAVVAHHHPSGTRHPSRQRQALETRNALLTAVMRLPWPTVLSSYASVVTTPPGRRGAWQTLRRLPAALRRRHVVPPEVLRLRRLLV